MCLFLEIYRTELLTLCMLGNFACFYGKRFGVKPNKAIIMPNKKISVFSYISTHIFFLQFLFMVLKGFCLSKFIKFYFFQKIGKKNRRFHQ